MAHHEPPHQGLRCLQIQLFSSLVLKELIGVWVVLLEVPAILIKGNKFCDFLFTCQAA